MNDQTSILALLDNETLRVRIALLQWLRRHGGEGAAQAVDAMVFAEIVNFTLYGEEPANLTAIDRREIAKARAKLLVALAWLKEQGYQ